MKGEPRPVEDFAEIFAAFRNSEEPILLVGGHAVNVWALSYYDRARSEILPYEPLTSSDMDIYATRNALLWLNSELGGKLYSGGPREVVLGAIELKVGQHSLLIEVLRSVKGVTDAELKSRAALRVSGYEILVPLPHVLLKAKLSNALELEQEDRQDVKHVRLLAVVLREYILDLVAEATEENDRELLEIVRGSVEVAKSNNAKAFEEEHGIRFDKFLPLESLAKASAKLKTYVEVEYKKRYGA